MPVEKAGRFCTIDGCQRLSIARGWCSPHYQRWLRHGDPLAGGRSPNQICQVAGCDRQATSQGWCNAHYLRWRKHGDPLVGGPLHEHVVRPKGVRCAVPGCDRPHAARGWCKMHWRRWKRNGDPLVRVQLPHPENLMSRLIVMDSGCVEFTGYTDENGYGIVSRGGGGTGAHRAMWELMIGPVPPAHEVHHKCENTACVNPGHLEIKSVQDHRALHGNDGRP